MTQPMDRYPHIARRYVASLIDAWLVMTFGFVLAGLLRSDATASFRALVFVLVLLLYEPVLTSRRCTLGQRLMGVRVRDNRNWSRIGIPRAYLRIVIKLVLGWISFVTVFMTAHRRGVHDLAANSVVLSAKLSPSADWNSQSAF